MKLNEVYSNPVKEVISKMDLSDMKIHADDEGNVRAIELKYTEKAPEPKEQAHHPWA